jgi:DNA-directed RNA polymerase specialized sigma24 family protein
MTCPIPSPGEALLEVLHAHRRGDRAATSRAFAVLHRAVLPACHRRAAAGSRWHLDGAEDLAQQLHLKVFRSLSTISAETPAAAGAFLRVTLFRLAADGARRATLPKADGRWVKGRWVDPVDELPSSAQDPAASLDARRAIGKLGELARVSPRAQHLLAEALGAPGPGRDQPPTPHRRGAVERNRLDQERRRARIWLAARLRPRRGA